MEGEMARIRTVKPIGPCVDTEGTRDKVFGQDLSRCAKGKGFALVEHQKIVDLNEGLDFRKLAIGQKIKVPKKP